MILTARDMQDTLVRRLGGKADQEAVTDCRAAINDALNELWGQHEFPWYQQQGVLQFDEPYEEGTVTYVAATRRFTLTGGTWPAWAVYGTVRVNARDARVTRRLSATVIEIEDGTSFRENLASATSYTLYHDQYPIEGLVRKMSYLYIDENSAWSLVYVTPMEFRTRRPSTLGARPLMYTVVRDRYVPGGLVLQLWPYPGDDYTCRFSYIRSPRPVSIWSYTDGKVTTATDSDAVTGTNTLFAAEHENCLLRVGRDGSNVPSGLTGSYPFGDELYIDEVTGSGSLTVLGAATATKANVKYEISSPVDIDEVIMGSVFTQQCYMELGKRRGFDGNTMAVISKALDMALRGAKSKSVTNRDITYAGSFNSSPRYGPWYAITF